MAKKEKRKGKLDRIMYEKNISLKKLHIVTGLANPVLLDIKKCRRTSREEFDARTILTLEKFLKIPAEGFLGWEEKEEKEVTNNI